jgi:hypothetical protein
MNAKWEQDDFEEPFLIHDNSTQKPSYSLQQEANSSIYQQNQLWDQVNLLRHYNRESKHHYKLKYNQSNNDNEEETQQQMKPKLPTVQQLRSLKYIRQKYGIPSRVATSDPNAEWRKRRVLLTPNNMNPLNFNQNDITQLKRQVNNFQNWISGNEPSSDKVLLEREFDIEMKSNPNYAKQLITAVNKQRRNNNSLNTILEKEMNKLIARGRQRETEIAQSIRFISQYLLSEQDIRRGISQMSNGNKKKKKGTTQQQESNILNTLPVNYDIHWKRQYNRAVMSVFDKKHKEIFNPFGISIEPPTNPEAYDPLAFEFVVFDPPKSVRKDVTASKHIRRSMLAK